MRRETIWQHYNQPHKNTAIKFHDDVTSVNCHILLLFDSFSRTLQHTIAVSAKTKVSTLKPLRFHHKVCQQATSLEFQRHAVFKDYNILML